MCRLLGVSPSGYYAWVKRRPSRRARADADLTEQIRVAHAGSRGTYGAPRVQAELAAKGIRAGRKRIARLMAQSGLAGVSRRKFVTTTVNDGGRQAPDLVERNFVAERPDLLWVADITYIPTWAGFLYLAVVLDAFSRRIVGWSMGTTLATQLVLDALNMALATAAERRDPPLRPGLSVHVDRVRPPLSGGGRTPLDGLGRRCLRQCDVRELLRHARMRASRPAPVQDAGRGANGGVRVRRGLLQSSPPPFLDRVPLTCRVRAVPPRERDRSRRTRACHRACGRQEQALRAAPRRGRS